MAESQRTDGVHIVLVCFRALSAEEQEEAYALVGQARLERMSAGESDTARYLRALIRVRELVGREPSVDDYKQAWRDLRDRGESIPPLHAQIKHFGSWRLAKEALGLAGDETPRMIRERFRKRRLGKIYRYRDETLRETLERCARDLGRVPLLAEFEAWRERELELARARGDEAHLPSPTPYRKRWHTWEGALLHHGFPAEQVSARLEEASARVAAGRALTTLRWGVPDPEDERDPDHPAPG